MIEQGSVRKAVLKDVLELAPKIRKGDRLEILASDNVSPLEALVLPFTQKGARIYTIVGSKEEGIVGMFGSTPTKEKGYGVVWLLSSEDLFKHIKQFIKECPQWVADMSKGYDHVYNFVDDRNWKSLKWLQFLGFEPKRKIKDFGIGKMPFILMMKEVNK
jgi:hypothetical protein